LPHGYTIAVAARRGPTHSLPSIRFWFVFEMRPYLGT
jgi:hypothetical protein